MTAEFDFDAIMKKVQEFAQAASAKTGEVIEISKLKLKSTKILGEIDRAYRRLGEVVFESKKTGELREGLIELCIADIDALFDELMRLNDQINEVRNVSVCPKCGADNMRSATMCVRCKSPLPTNAV